MRSNKHFQDCVNDLVELVTEGEEIVPLCNEDYSFDRVWQLKARFFYHVLSNFKAMHDSGSASLASLIVD